MNCKEAKQISIVGYLQNRGFAPAKTQENNLWYNSPLHRDETASFKVDKIKNLWYDHGIGKGGNLIDLVCTADKTNIQGALQILEGIQIPNISLSFQQQKEHIPSFKIDRIQPIQNKALINYIEHRGISLQIASQYLNEAYWKSTNITTEQDKTYFGLAFKNDLGGYELNFGIGNKSIKLSTSPKGITTIPGSKNHINVFEGFFDFLSYLIYSKLPRAFSTIIVLNSLSNIGNIMEILKFYDNISLYLDNDEAGLRATKQIKDKYPHAINRSKSIYPGSKDFNEFLMKLNYGK